MLRDGDLERVADLMRDTAAQELLSRFRKLAKHDIREKTPGDLVTVADERSEQRLASGLATILPGVPVVGEEAVAAEPGLVAHIDTSDAAWIVDPLDGTANFARGSDRFAMIVALVRRGETIAGWIYEPVQERMAVAGLGAGAFLNNAPMRLPTNVPLKQCTGYVGVKFKQEFLRKTKPAVLNAIGRLTTFGCAGKEYIDLIAGRAHFSFYRWTKPWDHAAGALLVREAGGVANRHDGKPYSASQAVNAGILTASDPARWQELRTMFDQAAVPLLEIG
ncbi:MAG TPA: inositol monophosphatase [Vineibacter sp.]|nr:inositol monophosphatase [Vineibacter sp.]